MYLELHSGEEGNSLTAKIKYINYDYEAEEWVQDTHNDDRAANVIKWVLCDEIGVRCVWERPNGASSMPDIAQRSSRFTGEWVKGPNEVIID